MNGPNELKCYITLGRKGLSDTNTPALWDQFKVKKKMQDWKNKQVTIHIYNTLFSLSLKAAQ
jgi:hypothetical protein